MLGERQELPLTEADLATRPGLAQATLSRTLARFQQAPFIQPGGRQVVILEAPALDADVRRVPPPLL